MCLHPNEYKRYLAMKDGSWIGVDLDGTLATYDTYGDGSIGEPIPLMVARVRAFLEAGQTVKILTARLTHPNCSPIERVRIQDWLVQKAGLPRLEVTSVKDFGMIQLWDDRAIQVQKNTGKVRPTGAWVDNNS
jgi:hypothetical protein